MESLKSAAMKREALKRTIKAIKKFGKRRKPGRKRQFPSQKSQLTKRKDNEANADFPNGDRKRRVWKKEGRASRRLKPVAVVAEKHRKSARESTTPAFNGVTMEVKEDTIFHDRLKTNLQSLPDRKSNHRKRISNKAYAGKMPAEERELSNDFSNAAAHDDVAVDDAFIGKQRTGSSKRAEATSVPMDRKNDLLVAAEKLLNEMDLKQEEKEIQELQKHDSILKMEPLMDVDKEKNKFSLHNKTEKSGVPEVAAISSRSRTNMLSKLVTDKKIEEAVSDITIATACDSNDENTTNIDQTASPILIGETEDTDLSCNTSVNQETTKLPKPDSESIKVSAVKNKLRKISELERLLPENKFRRGKGFQRLQNNKGDKFRKFTTDAKPEQSRDDSENQVGNSSDDRSKMPHSHYYQVLEYVKLPDNFSGDIQNDSGSLNEGKNENVENEVDELSDDEERLSRDNERNDYSLNVQREADLTLITNTTDVPQQADTVDAGDENSQFNKTAFPVHDSNTETTEEFKSTSAAATSLASRTKMHRSSQYTTAYRHTTEILSSTHTILSTEILHLITSTEKPEQILDADVNVNEPVTDIHISPEDIDRPALYDKKDGIGFPNEDTLVNGDVSLYNKDNDEESKNNELKISVRIKHREGNETDNITSTISSNLSRPISVRKPAMEPDATDSEVNDDMQRLMNSTVFKPLPVRWEFKPSKVIMEFERSKDNLKLIPVMEVIDFGKRNKGVNIPRVSKRAQKSE